MAKSVRLADIAVKMDVSIVTVSKALSGQKGVSETMREKIVALADELGYVQPSAVKKKKKDAVSYNIGVLIEESYLDQNVSFYWKMYQKVATLAVEKESFTLLEVISKQMEAALEMPRLLAESKVDGLIVIGKVKEFYLEKLMKHAKIPFVYMDFSDGNQGADAVVSDSFYGAYCLTNYLIGMGHTEIAYVGTLLATSSITDRYLGYVKALLEHGISPRSEWQIDDRYLENGFIDEEKLLKLPERMPTAFFCNCDLTAGKLIRKLQTAGYKVPEDISVVGYDNYIYPGVCDVAITTYEVDFNEMARDALEVLLQKLAKNGDMPKIHIVEGHMVIKNSVSRIDGGVLR